MESGRIGQEADRAAGLRPQPATQSSLSSIPCAVTLRADFADGTHVTVERDRIYEAIIVMVSACLPAAEFIEEPTPVDDDETRAFIEGWNARLLIPDFDKALHFWNRRRAGI